MSIGCPSRGFCTGSQDSPRPPGRLPSISKCPECLTLLRFRTRKKSLAFCWESWTPSSVVTQLSHARQSLKNILASASLWNSPFYERKVTFQHDCSTNTVQCAFLGRVMPIYEFTKHRRQHQGPGLVLKGLEAGQSLPLSSSRWQRDTGHRAQPTMTLGNHADDRGGTQP